MNEVGENTMLTALLWCGNDYPKGNDTNFQINDMIVVRRLADHVLFRLPILVGVTKLHRILVNYSDSPLPRLLLRLTSCHFYFVLNMRRIPTLVITCDIEFFFAEIARTGDGTISRQSSFHTECSSWF